MRRLLAELLGTGLLVTIVVGSGIAAQRLSPGDTGLQLLENALATGFGLAVLIAVFQPISGAHFNPVVTLADATLGGTPWRAVGGYLPAQLIGAALGSITAHLMFAEPAIQVSTHERSSWPQLFSEGVATAGLVLVIFTLVRTGRATWVAPSVGAYIAAAYFFTSSTSFANPAVTFGRIFTDTFAGIAPTSALWFAAAQLVGGAVGLATARALTPAPAAPPRAADARR